MITRVGMVVLLVSATMAARAPGQQPKMPRQGYKAPDFTLQSIDGQEVTLSKLLADSPVVLVVLRGWPGYQCPLCTLQVADLKKHAAELSKLRAKVVLVYPGPADKLTEHAQEFLKGKPLPENFVLVTDPDYRFTAAYALRWDAPMETAYPATMVIDRQRTIRFVTISKTHGERAKTADVLKALPGG